MRSVGRGVHPLTIALMAVLVLFLPSSPASMQPRQRALPQESVPKRTKLQGPAGHAKKAMHHDTARLFASHYDTRGRWQSLLTLNNKGADPMTPTVTAYSADGQLFRLPPTTVPGDSFVEIDLGERLGHLGQAFAHGSLEVSYYGKKLEMGAQVLVQDRERGLQFAEQLTYGSTDLSGRTTAAWWLPAGASTRQILVLTNTTDSPVSLNVMLHEAVRDGARGRRPTDEAILLRLGPRGQRTLDLEPPPGSGRRSPASVSGATVSFDGGPGAVMARALIYDGRSGYSLATPLRPLSSKTPTLHGGGVRLRDSAGRAMRPYFVARNSSPSRTTVTGRLVVTAGDEDVVVPLPVSFLEAGQTTLLDFGNAWRTAAALDDVSGVGVELEHASSPGHVTISASAASRDDDEVFSIPLIDPETPPSSSGGYPWQANDDVSTVVHLKNTTNLPQVFLLQLSFPSGAYAPGLKIITPGQSITIDIRQLRDQQVPDRLGRTIPLNATYGQVHWSAKGRGRHVIIGRAEHVGTNNRTSASYACVNCCPDNPYESWSEPGSFDTSMGVSTTIIAWLRDIDCYDTVLEQYDLGNGGLQWSSSNTSVATVSWGEVTPIGDGTAYIFGYYYTEWWNDQNTDCESDPYLVVYESQVNSACRVPVISRASASTMSDGTLDVVYTYTASPDGARSLLAGCKVGEETHYVGSSQNPYPWPYPWIAQANNPTITQAPFLDPRSDSVDHHYPSEGYSYPLTGASFSAQQRYWYSCACRNNGAIQYMTSPVSIDRSLTDQGDATFPWLYKVTKAGDEATAQIAPSIEALRSLLPGAAPWPRQQPK